MSLLCPWTPAVVMDIVVAKCWVNIYWCQHCFHPDNFTASTAHYATTKMRWFSFILKQFLLCNCRGCTFYRMYRELLHFVFVLSFSGPAAAWCSSTRRLGLHITCQLGLRNIQMGKNCTVPLFSELLQHSLVMLLWGALLNFIYSLWK